MVSIHQGWHRHGQGFPAVREDTYAWILHLQGQESLARFYMLRAMEKAGDMSEDPELKQHFNIMFGKDENKEE